MKIEMNQVHICQAFSLSTSVAFESTLLSFTTLDGDLAYLSKQTTALLVIEKYA